MPAMLITKRPNNTANARLILVPEQTEDELKLFPAVPHPFDIKIIPTTMTSPM
jgi:hypothetical protein